MLSCFQVHFLLSVSTSWSITLRGDRSLDSGANHCYCCWGNLTLLIWPFVVGKLSSRCPPSGGELRLWCNQLLSPQHWTSFSGPSWFLRYQSHRCRHIPAVTSPPHLGCLNSSLFLFLFSFIGFNTSALHAVSSLLFPPVTAWHVLYVWTV